MLLVLLKSVKKWVFDFIFINNWADKEAELYFKKRENDESN